MLSFRWPFITAVAMLALTYNASEAIIQDPEQILPIVIDQYTPVFLKGFLVSGLN